MPDPQGHRFDLLRVTDESGRRIQIQGSGYSNTNWGFGLNIKDGVQHLEVTVALHRSRFVEFAQPTRWDGKP